MGATSWGFDSPSRHQPFLLSFPAGGFYRPEMAITGDMRKFFYSFEVSLLAYMAVVSFLLILRNAEGLWGFLGLHFMGSFVVVSVAWVERRYPRRFWTILRHWLPILFVLAFFRELTFLIPEVHSFDDQYFDRLFSSWDQRLFGDVAGRVSTLWWPPFVEFLHYCYWFYFPMPAILALIFWRRGDEEQYRHFGTLYVTTMVLGYLCYMVFPAVGPQHFEFRAEALDGLWLGGWMHTRLRELEMITPDAFPSLHTAVALLVLAYAWRTHRKYFWCMLLPGGGLILSTVILRYHYVVDILAALVFVPVAMLAAHGLYRLCSGSARKPREE